jgi:hypothetical protein
MTTNSIPPALQDPVTPATATVPEPTNPTRGTASVEKPFIWQAKAALRRIRDAFDHLAFLNQAIAVYVTLTEFASDTHSEIFTRRRREIAERSGVSLRRVQIILNIFKKIGVVTWKQNQGAGGTEELAPSTYTLCSVCPTQCTGNPTLGKTQKRQNCTVHKQSPEESPNNSDKASVPTKTNKLSARQKELADRFEATLGNQWTNDAGKWIDRIKSAPDKCGRVIAEVECAVREDRIKTSPAQYAEQIWKEFAP